MKRAIPWTTAVVAVVAFSVSLFQLRDARGRYHDLIREQGSEIDSQSSRIDRLSEIVTLSEQHGIGVNHTDIRIFAIKNQIAQSLNPVVVVGDSITEGALLPSEVCGKTVINAGIGGTDTHSYQRIATEIFAVKPAALIIIALGTNDSTRSVGSPDGFAASYSALIDVLVPHAEKILLAGIPAIQPDGAMASQFFDSAVVDRHNEEISTLSRRRSIGFIDLHAIDSGGTTDGVHLDAARYKAWTSAIVSAIDTSFACRPTAFR
jgi:lysophospholipase L1-like esterase